MNDTFFKLRENFQKPNNSTSLDPALTNFLVISMIGGFTLILAAYVICLFTVSKMIEKSGCLDKSNRNSNKFSLNSD